MEENVKLIEGVNDYHVLGPYDEEIIKQNHVWSYISIGICAAFGTAWPFITMFADQYVTITGFRFTTWTEAAYSLTWLFYFLISGSELIVWGMSMMMPLTFITGFAWYANWVARFGVVVLYFFPILFFILGATVDNNPLVGNSLMAFIISIFLWITISVFHFLAFESLVNYSK